MIANFDKDWRKAVWGRRAALAVVCASALSAGCGDAIRQGRGPAALVLDSLTGASTGSTTFSNVVASDVLRGGGVLEDQGRAALRVQMKDAAVAPTANNAVTITRYRVTYLRADGRNTPGVDVPYPFDGAVTATVTGTSSIGFTLVRIQAKLEEPLRGLSFDGGANVISTFAQVTFYGTDTVGNAVSVSGQIEVNFSDWAG